MLIEFEENKMHREHEEKYEAEAQWLGIKNLKKLLNRSGEGTYGFGSRDLKKFGSITKERVKIILEEGDEHLNKIPLGCWDLRHDDVLALVREALRGTGQKKSWSLCNSVCVLKHVAKYHL